VGSNISAVKTEAVFSSETSVLTYKTLTPCHNTEDHHRIISFNENERISIGESTATI
jgi:hypothetical protein